MTARTALTTVLVVALGLLLGLSSTVGSSSASFTSASTNSQGTVRAAADWTPPAVSLASPGLAVAGTVTLTATASDAESGLESVGIQYQPSSGGMWTTLCTDSTAPYSCAWSTGTVTDGSYDLRAVAVDGAGYTTTSATVSTTVANLATVLLTDPGDVLRGTVELKATVLRVGLTIPSVRFEYAPAGSTTWQTACTTPVGLYTCSWNTSALTGDYDLRAVAVTATASTASAVRPDVLVDNTAPRVTMTDPGTPLSGTRTFAATATDVDSGIAQVVLQYARTDGGTTAYQNLCTVIEEPFACRYDTTKLPDGTYSYRAVATDAAGNTTTSTAVTGRAVDNTVSSVSLEDPGAYLTGVETLTAAAHSTAGVRSVRIEHTRAGTSTFTTICTDTTAPYTCDWTTTAVADGAYDLRAVLTDGAGKETVSTVLSSRQVDNAPLRGADVQTANGGTTAGRADARDSITFTYTGLIAPSSVTPGWDGTQVPVTVTLTGATGGSTLKVERTGSTVNLGSVHLKQTYVRSGRSTTFGATMSTSTVVVNGVSQTTVTVALGAVTSGAGQLRTASTAAAMVWTPSAAVRDLAGKSSSTSPVTESGALDREF